MQNALIDLHVHSTCSDGTYTPAELVELALKKSLQAIAITDHDTTDGVLEAVEAAKGTALRIIPGIELSTAYEQKDIHILGLNIDIQNTVFQKRLKEFQQLRNQRNQKILGKLRNHGLLITWEAMEASFPDSVWTRAHFARYLMDTGQVHTLTEAFGRYLGDHAPCFVPREKVTPFDAISLIHKSGGKAVLAHPLLYHLPQEKLEELTGRLVRSGLDGIEAIYSANKGMDEPYLRRLAKKYSLIITGGSDFHGSNKPAIQLGSGKGKLKVPASLLEGIDPLPRSKQ